MCVSFDSWSCAVCLTGLSALLGEMNWHYNMRPYFTTTNTQERVEIDPLNTPGASVEDTGRM